MQNTIFYKGRNHKYFKTQISKVSSRRHHPLVRSWNQRLHAFPTASNSRVGEGEKMSWGNFWENEIGCHHFSSAGKTRIFTELQQLVNTIKAGIPGGQLLRAPNSQRPPRATKALWLAIFGKIPPAPSGTEHWILGHQGLQPRVLTKIYVWASRRGVPLIIWYVSPPATNRNTCFFIAKSLVESS